MKTIYKYQLPVLHGLGLLMLPQGARPLHVDTQDDTPYVWMEVDTGGTPVNRPFACVWTGREVPDDAKNMTYIGTAVGRSDGLVTHYYM